MTSSTGRQRYASPSNIRSEQNSQRKRTAARRRDGKGREWTVIPHVQQVVTRHRQAGQARKQFGAVNLLEPPVNGVLQHLRPDRPRPHRSRTASQCFAPPPRHGRTCAARPGLHARRAGEIHPQCHRHDTSLSVQVVIATRSARLIEINRFELFVNQLDVPMRRRQRGQVGQRQRHDRPAANPEHGAVRLRAVKRGLNDEKDGGPCVIKKFRRQP